ncbi:MAG: DNA polymerase III subunit delta', partial [Atopobium sp.]|nr:DNA polymerase III subunit delta' [Atopobium sp.]
LRNDSWVVLTSAKELIEAAKIPLGDVRRAQEEALAQNEDFLTSAALKQVEAANKRELTARERSGIIEMLAILESLLRDVLLCCEAVDEEIVNTDAAGIIDRVASQTHTQGVLGALAAVQEAQYNLDRSVSPQLTLEVMLLHIKEALTCPPLSR